MLVKSTGFDGVELDRFRALQRTSFDILQSTARTLSSGDTEQSVARALVKKYRAAGAQSFFHLPVALFGERTALPGDWSLGHFFPRDRKLQPGDSVILDAAPIFDGFLVDTSYSFCFGEAPAHRDMMVFLSQFRESVPEAVNRGDTFKAISEAVLQTFQAAGYEPAHTKHPGAVLGHRAVKLPRLPFQRRNQGFDALSLGWFKFKDSLAATPFGRHSPLWNHRHTSDHAPHDGLWLVEPHAGRAAVGAKWEEILVIEGGRAHWLDDAPPHVRQWQNIHAGERYAP